VIRHADIRACGNAGAGKQKADSGGIGLLQMSMLVGVQGSNLRHLPCEW
jgi:hypothetical protein